MPGNVRAQIAEHIARAGRSVLSVFDDPPFTYTIGNHLAGKPELLIFGLRPEDAQVILNAASVAPSIAGLAHGDLVDIGGRFPLKALRCAEWAKGRYSIQAGVYLGTEGYRLFQLLAPDPAGRFPGDPACAAPYRDVLLLDGEEARNGALHS